MAEHHASVTVNASVHQVYGLFSHFNDFPKFMSFVKEVTYYDDQKSHWVAEILGRHEWDAVNENWVEDQQIGWRSTSGLDNFGRVMFQPSSNNQTLVDVAISYDPPAGILGDAGEALGGGSRFQNALEHDLNHFAEMVDQAPEGSLDPMSSNYLFHSDSAAAHGRTTTRQNDSMMDENLTTNSGTYSQTSPSSMNNVSDTDPDATLVPGGNRQRGNTPYTSDQDIINESSQGIGGPTGRTETRLNPEVTNVSNTTPTTDTDYGTPVDMQDSSIATGRDEGSGTTNPRDLGNAGGGPVGGASGLSSGGMTGRDTTLDGTGPNGYPISDRDALENANPTSNYEPERNLGGRNPVQDRPTGDRDARKPRLDPTDPMQSRDWRRNEEGQSTQE